MSFETALAFALRWEGGYVNDPDDPGGATNRGVTHGVYDAYRAAKGEKRRSVKEITDEEVRDIYRSLYWDVARCPEIDPVAPTVAAVHFDVAVNGGPRRAAVLLQRAIGVTADGAFGPKTLAALFDQAQKGEKVIARAAVDRRDEWYRAIAAGKPTSAKFLRGWLNRTAALRKEHKL